MSEIVILGIAPSSFVRTARMTCVEKGVPHRLEPLALGSDTHLAKHPWGKVPVMRHGDFELIETSAIVRYIDEAFPGPSLVPGSPTARATMEQWISVVNSYLYDSLIRKYALEYILPTFRNEEPNRAAIDAGVPAMQRDLKRLDAAYDKGSFIAGDGLSLADLFVAPVLATVSAFPEGKEALGATKNLGRVLGTLAQRKSFQIAHEGLGR